MREKNIRQVKDTLMLLPFELRMDAVLNLALILLASVTKDQEVFDTIIQGLLAPYSYSLPEDRRI
jgi:hypothetical protein